MPFGIGFVVGGRMLLKWKWMTDGWHTKQDRGKWGKKEMVEK